MFFSFLKMEIFFITHVRVRNLSSLWVRKSQLLSTIRLARQINCVPKAIGLRWEKYRVVSKVLQQKHLHKIVSITFILFCFILGVADVITKSTCRFASSCAFAVRAELGGKNLPLYLHSRMDFFEEDWPKHVSFPAIHVLEQPFVGTAW